MTKSEDCTLLIPWSPGMDTVATCIVCCAVIYDSSLSTRKWKSGGVPSELNEYCSMYLMLGTHCNRANSAVKECAERCLAHCLPNANVFYQRDQRMRGVVMSTNAISG